MMGTLSRTFTRTYNSIDFADPYKLCNSCGEWITGVLDMPIGPLIVLPCEHNRGYSDECPSWSPVDGCQCWEFLGRCAHGEPPARGT